jgi:ribosomal protein S18 acetylase RimI-like enzyme
MSSPVTFRSAVAADIEQLIDLMLVSSWGGIRLAWERVRAADETWRDRGRAEIADRDSEIGFSRFVVAETDSRLAAMVLLNLVGDTSRIDVGRAVDAEAGALRLIRQCQGSIFIREIATADWARGRGLGREMVELAEKVAATNGAARVTLIVNDANTAAERLYRRLGYQTIAEEASLGHPRFPDGSRLLLMEKPTPKKEGAPGSAP